LDGGAVFVVDSGWEGWGLVVVEDVDRPSFSGGEEGQIVLDASAGGYQVKVCNGFDFFLGWVVAIIDYTSARVGGWDPDIQSISLDVVGDYTVWMVDASKIKKVSTLTEIYWHIRILIVD
jgi:hypothetical protein